MANVKEYRVHTVLVGYWRAQVGKPRGSTLYVPIIEINFHHLQPHIIDGRPIRVSCAGRIGTPGHEEEFSANDRGLDPKQQHQ